jgi:Carboxypeptidase regulatory-like domain
MFHMTRHGTLALLAIGLAGCDNGRSPTAPSSPDATVHVAPGPTQGGIPIAGIVYDTAYRYMAGARIEVIDGPQAGMSTETDSQGRFTLTGVFDDTTRFVATKDGHLPATSTLGPFCAQCHPNRWINFNLEELVPPPNLSGDWQVTFVTNPACTDLPSELRTRSYDATIALAPPAAHPDAQWLFVVTMTSVPFVSSYKEFHIGAAGNYLGFPENDGPALVEELDPTTYLSFNALGISNGAVTGATTGSIITTGFDSTEYRSSSTHVACTGNNRLILIRR